MIDYEYGIRRTDESASEIRWADSDGEVFLGDYIDNVREGIGFTNSEDLPTLLRNVKEHNAHADYVSKFEVLERHYSEPVVIDSVPLPSTPGSVVRKDGVIYVLTDDEDNIPWIAVDADRSERWVGAESLKGADVLYVPAEA